jgi:hypothetical protein
MMASQPRDDLEQQYNNLTEKQQAVIDAHSENPNETNRRKAEIAGEKIGDSVNESYCSQVLNSKYPELANYREEIVQNERSEGEMTTEGDPFSAIPDESGGFQSIQDRPVTETQQDDSSSQVSASAPTAPRKAVQIQQQDDGLLVWFDERYLRELLESQELPPQLHQRLVDAVLSQAFN